MSDVTQKPPVLPAAPGPRELSRRPVTAAVPTAVVELGAMAHMAGATLRRGLRRPFDWGPEFISQFTMALRVVLVPLMITSFALSFGPAGIQATNFLGLFGALDRLGAAYQLIVVREFAPLVTAIIVAGAAGTAMTSDLGARRVREELDALSVLGVDVLKSIVMPRLLAIVTLATLCNVFALLAGMTGAVAVVLQNHAPLGPFFATFLSNSTTIEFGAAVLKTAVYGGMIAVVCCYKGLNASGGAAGVGRAVNQAVVVTFLLIGAIDYVFTQFLLATHPILSATR